MTECGIICSKEEALKYMMERIVAGENSTKEILVLIGEIREGNMGAKYSLDAIKEALKENKERIALGTLKHEAERVAETKRRTDMDAATLKEKRATRKAIYVAVAVVVANTLIGLYLQ